MTKTRIIPGVHSIVRTPVILRVPRVIIRAVMAMAAAFFLFSCAGNRIPAAMDYPGLVAEDGSILLFFNLSEESVLPERAAAVIGLDQSSEDFYGRTEKMYISIGGYEKRGKFSMAAEGRYPGNIVNFMFRRDDNWERRRGTYTWWNNREENLEAAVFRSNGAVISNGNMKTLLDRMERGEFGYIPDSVRTMNRRLPLVIYSRNPDPLFFLPFGMEGRWDIVREILIGFYPDNSASDPGSEAGEKNNSGKKGSSYTIEGKVTFEDPQTARTFTTLFRLALITKTRIEGVEAFKRLLADGVVRVEDNSMVFSGIPIALEELDQILSASLNINTLEMQ